MKATQAVNTTGGHLDSRNRLKRLHLSLDTHASLQSPVPDGMCCLDTSIITAHRQVYGQWPQLCRCTTLLPADSTS
jgi:hypothetical protein